MSEDGRVVTAEFTNTMLAGHDWRRGSISRSYGDGWEEFWFDGYTNPGPLPPPGRPRDSPHASSDRA